MSWIPGWDSIVSAGWWSGFYFWLSICALISLGIFEVASHRYSDRKDELATAEQEAIQRRHDEDMARVQHDAARLSVEAEASRQKNLEFEAALAPRILEQNLSAQALNQYSGTRFVVISPNDFEIRRMAGQIRFMLVQAGWAKATEDLPENNWFPDGITIRYNLGAALQDGRTLEAAKALVEQLKVSNIEARLGPPNRRLPPQVILIVVGAKPLPPSLMPSPDRFPGGASGSKMFGNVLDENWSGPPPVHQEPPK